MFDLVPLNIYGVYVCHPKQWQLYFNPNTKINFDEGLVKIDKVDTNKNSATSLTVRWAKMYEDITLDEYVNELEKQFEYKQRKSKNKDRYKINKVSEFTLDTNQKAYIIKSEFVANHNIYRLFGKSELVKVIQVVTYSEETKRMIIASLSTTPEEYKYNESNFVTFLTKLKEDTNSNKNVSQESLHPSI